MRRRAPVRILAHMHPVSQPLQLTIELDPYVERQAPSGWLRAPAAPPRRFESYVHLIGALHELWLAAAQPPNHQSESEETDARDTH
jgi:hypothetical protein